MGSTTTEIEIDVGDVLDRRADDRGRIAIGPEYADRSVRVAVVEVFDDDDAQSGNQQQSG